MFKGQAARIGLGLIAAAVLVMIAIPFLFDILGGAPILGGLYLFAIALLGVSGFGFLVASTFLRADKRAEPTFTQQLLGKEKLDYGIYTKGNWKTVLEEEDKEEKKRQEKKRRRW